MMDDHWKSDSQATCCKSCNQSFSSVIRKHHCRLCGEVFCDKCSSKKLTIPDIPDFKNQRVCDKCYLYQTKHLPYLTAERHFLRYERGKVSAVTVFVSADQKELCVRYMKNEFSIPESTPLSSVQSVQEGLNTSVWESHIQGCLCFGGASLDPSLCFSICTLKETIDLKADTLNTRQEFVQALQGLLSIRSSNAGKFIEKERTKVVEKNKAERIQAKNEQEVLIQKKYEAMRANLHKKYNVT